MFSNFQTFLFSIFTKNILLNMFIHTENNTETHQNKQFIIQNTPTKPQYISNNPFSSKYISFGLPGHLRTALELNKWFAYVKNTPSATTLTLHALNWLKNQKYQNTLSNFSNLLFLIFLYMLRATQPN